MGRYIPQLDGLRTVAVLLVIGTHTAWVPGGYVGVDVFFALSGYLITTILLREHAGGCWSLKTFYLRRARRLYPALLAMLIVGIPFGAAIAFSVPHYLGAAIISGTYLSDFVNAASASFLGGLGHTWSLSVEEQFYLLWPIVLLGLLRLGRRPRWATLAVATAAMLVALIIVPPRMLYLPFTRGGVLLLGCMLGLGMRGRALPKPTLVSGVSAVVLATVVILAPEPGLPDAGLASVIAGIAATGVIAGIVQGGLVARALSWKPLVWIGRRSYGVYLWHAPLLYLLEQSPSRPDRTVQLFLGDFLGSVVLAALSYRLIESRFLRRNRTDTAPAPDRAAAPAFNPPVLSEA